jgi:hypothetical protein
MEKFKGNFWQKRAVALPVCAELKGGKTSLWKYPERCQHPQLEEGLVTQPLQLSLLPVACAFPGELSVVSPSGLNPGLSPSVCGSDEHGWDTGTGLKLEADGRDLKLFSLWKPPSCEGKFCGGVGGICQP